MNKKGRSHSRRQALGSYLTLEYPNIKIFCASLKMRQLTSFYIMIAIIWGRRKE